ncbi:transglutaminase domain-containing protein [Paenibacillus albiflavus]|nr:transglutaminase-like domain-containing protein [Paenibacillus albiflavus]
MVVQGLVTIISLIVAWLVSHRLSDFLHEWLVGKNIEVPIGEISMWKQIYYTVVTGFRDFPLFRLGVLLLVIYLVLRPLLSLVATPLLFVFQERQRQSTSRNASLLSLVIGGLIGFLIGSVRAIILIMILFIVATLFPQSKLASHIEASSLYQQGAKQIIEPFAGSLIADHLPLLSEALEKEYQGILGRKYEVLDANISDSVIEAAKEVTAKGETQEEKARLLYNWVGTRIQYDFDKVKQYEEKRIWKEQTPDDTFATRLGVCIDYSRLYAVMAKTVGLEAKVVTGLGLDGKGGSGAHAWNEVWIEEQKAWIPLDTTWVSAGGNWFNPPHFNDTHIRGS